MGAAVTTLLLERGEASLHDSFNSDTTSLDSDERADAIINSFYNELRRRHAREREILEDGSCDIPATKWNQQEVYLDYEQFFKAQVASRRHLERHRDWLSGPKCYGDVALHDLVAVQHYIDLDFEDLTLPPEKRRNQDAFFGADGNICEQMLLDVPRCAMKVDGNSFSFSDSSGQDSPGGPEVDQAERMTSRKAYTESVVEAMMQCLRRHGEPPALLVRAVTSVMSQSGLASMERACHSSQVVVSGGTHIVEYELGARQGKAWDVTLSVRKTGFDKCIVWSEWPGEDPDRDGNAQDAPLVVQGSPTSFVSKLCGIRVFMSSCGSRVEADVFKIRKEMSLADDFGQMKTGLKVGLDFSSESEEPEPTEVAYKSETSSSAGRASAANARWPPDPNESWAGRREQD
jgi:hypothetical protein